MTETGWYIVRTWDTNTRFVRAQGTKGLVNVYVLGLAFTVRDHRLHRALLSERMPEHFTKREWRFHLGHWHFGVQRAWRWRP